MTTPDLVAIAEQAEAQLEPVLKHAQTFGSAAAWTAYRLLRDATRDLRAAQLHLEYDEKVRERLK